MKRWLRKRMKRKKREKHRYSELTSKNEKKTLIVYLEFYQYSIQNIPVNDRLMVQEIFLLS